MIDFPEKLECLFEPHRYKVLWGGRGGTKSWGAARALLLMGSRRRIRVVCGREVQKSIEESVHALFREIHSPRDRALFRVIYHRGLRASEPGLMNLSDYSESAGRPPVANLFVRR